MANTSVPSYRDNLHLRRSQRFRRAAERAIKLKDEIDERQVEYDEIRAQKLLPEMIEADTKRVDFHGSQVGVIERSAGKRLNSKRLITKLESMGIDLSALDDCYDPTDGSVHVEIRTPRSEEQKAAKTVTRALTRGGGEGES